MGFSCRSTPRTLSPPPLSPQRTISSNLAVDQRFANGTQGRLLVWHPGATESKRKAVPAYCPDLLARFCKETSLQKQEMLPDIGMLSFLHFLPSYSHPSL